MVRTLLVIFAIVVTATDALAVPPPPIIAPANRRFDHANHAQVAGKTPIDCAGCHKVNPETGKPLPGREHARCTSCHDIDRAKQSCDRVKIPGPTSPARQCAICHVSTRKACVPDDLPAPPTKPSFVPEFAHNQHMSLGAPIQSNCGLCHKPEVASPTSATDGHVACSACHNGRGSKITMAQCNACHVVAQAPVAQSPDPFAVRTFDHAKHHAVASQAACSTCHKTIANATADAMPISSMIGCQQSCHDGKQAFATTGTSCTKCHSGSTPAAKQRTDLPFSHAEHAKRNVAITDCAQCHTLAADGALLPPGTKKDHQPCSNSGCHQTEYASKAPKICGDCHDAQAPWAAAISRAITPATSEWFSVIDHKIHAPIATCEGCHGNKLHAGAAAPSGHKGCTGSTCHGGSPALAMTDCSACHKGTAPPSAPPSAWSVAATFNHTTHEIDPRSHTPTPCLECHASVPTATDLASIQAPTMNHCGSCHDGKLAFKTTGFECARCHAKGVAVSMVVR